MFTKTKKAFTIVELVIVIAVIAILMGIMFVGGTAISNNAKQSTLDSDFRTFETNLKAMINDPDADVIKTKATGLAPSEISSLMGKYFEGDIAVTFSDDDNKLETTTTTGPKANRSAFEAEVAMDDPYGMAYQMVILDNSDTEVTDITFMVYSYGKNKQTATTPAGSFDADDVGFVVRVIDSVVYTGEIAGNGTKDAASATNGQTAVLGKAYQDAVNGSGAGTHVVS